MQFTNPGPDIDNTKDPTVDFDFKLFLESDICLYHTVKNICLQYNTENDV